MNQKTIVADGLMSIDETCQFLRLSRTKVYLLMCDGSLPHCLIGRSRRIPRRAVVDFAERSLAGNISG